jgi:ankyrin repeat protein
MAKKGKVANLKKIIKNPGTDINFNNQYGNTALTMAVFAKKLPSIKALVEAGADVNKKADGETPLEIAEKGGDKAIVDYLKSKGAK